MKHQEIIDRLEKAGFDDLGVRGVQATYQHRTGKSKFPIGRSNRLTRSDVGNGSLYVHPEGVVTASGGFKRIAQAVPATGKVWDHLGTEVPAWHDSEPEPSAVRQLTDYLPR